ncbi:MAG: hypothetical protein JWM49_2321 [Microbacteriaceae bacterium]|jgi:hypothetical protein|nr:hypothetical protein [Microbacteriaceae bacterium]
MMHNNHEHTIDPAAIDLPPTQPIDISDLLMGDWPGDSAA